MSVSCVLSYCTYIPIMICFINIFIAIQYCSSCISSFHISKFDRISFVAFVDLQYFRDVPRQLKNMLLHVIPRIYYPYKWHRLCENHRVFVCLYTRLSLCLFATLQKTYTQILMAISVYVGYDLRNITKIMDVFWIWTHHVFPFLWQWG